MPQTANLQTLQPFQFSIFSNRQLWAEADTKREVPPWPKVCWGVISHPMDLQMPGRLTHIFSCSAKLWFLLTWENQLRNTGLTLQEWNTAENNVHIEHFFHLAIFSPSRKTQDISKGARKRVITEQHWNAQIFLQSEHPCLVGFIRNWK